MTQQIKQFYNCIGFPGKYTIDQLLKYGDPIENPYLHIIESQIISEICNSNVWWFPLEQHN